MRGMDISPTPHESIPGLRYSSQFDGGLGVHGGPGLGYVDPPLGGSTGYDSGGKESDVLWCKRIGKMRYTDG